MKRRWLILMLLVISIAAGLAVERFSSPDIEVVKLKVENAWGDSWQGTGFFAADDLIVTAGHMVKGASFITVIFPDGEEFRAYDWYQEDSIITDAGIVRVKTPKREKKIKFVDCKVGDKVIAIGNPYGYFPVTTRGHVSGVNIDDDYFGEKNLLLVDVALNPGNSGCPLIGNGGVVGICVGGIFPGNNMCFVVPANIVQLVLDKYWAIEALKGAE